jgi:small subunit ribosomal protein S13
MKNPPKTNPQVKKRPQPAAKVSPKKKPLPTERKKQHEGHRGSVQYLLGMPRSGDPVLKKALRQRYGVGPSTVRTVCRHIGLNDDVNFSRLSREERVLLESYRTEDRIIETDRRRREHESLQRHQALSTVRGMRMRQGLPVRGQRTKTNARTARRRNRARVKEM